MERPEIGLETGVLLVAPPVLTDPNFRRSVVLLCEHSEGGSFGLILNHHVTVSMAELVEGLSSYRDPVRIGGPVQVDTVHFLHVFGDSIPDALEVVPGVFWGGEIEALERTVAERSPGQQDVRFFLGYAGWGAGQLDAEVSSGGWLLLEATSDLVFSSDPETLWRDCMLLMGGEYSLLANFPENPMLN